MNIKWRYFVQKIINIGQDFGVIWTYHRGPEFFETQCKYVCMYVCCFTLEYKENDADSPVTPRRFV